MGLMTPQQYKESLNDGRVVYYKGERVENVTTHPDLARCADLMALDYEMAEDPKYRDIAVMTDPDTGNPISRYYHKPANSEDLLKAYELIVKATETWPTKSRTVFQLPQASKSSPRMSPWRTPWMPPASSTPRVRPTHSRPWGCPQRSMIPAPIFWM